MKYYCHLAGFRARIQASADPPQRDMPDDHLPDPDDTANFELHGQQTLIDAFTAGLSKESQHDFRSLSALLATLPDPIWYLFILYISYIRYIYSTSDKYMSYSIL